MKKRCWEREVLKKPWPKSPIWKKRSVLTTWRSSPPTARGGYGCRRASAVGLGCSRRRVAHAPPRRGGVCVGGVEIVGGVLLLLGLCTRLASAALIIDMLVAIATTKIPILLKDGFWKMAHEARTDWSMLLGALFLLLVGAG